MTPLPAQIEIIDSRDDASITYIIVNNCKVPVKKIKVGDFCYVLNAIENTCHVTLDKAECEAGL